MQPQNHLYLLSTPDGFIARFWLMCQEYPSYSEAYEATERQHMSHFGQRKYSNYNSFRNVRDRVKSPSC